MSTTRRALRGPWVVGSPYSRSIVHARLRTALADVSASFRTRLGI